jgi:putative membrane protein
MFTPAARFGQPRRRRAAQASAELPRRANALRLIDNCAVNGVNMGDIVLTVLHHLAVFAIVAMLGAEFALVRGGITARSLPLLARLDAIYGGAAVLVLLAGVGRVFHNGAGLYMANPAFWTKMALFVAVGLASVPVTLAILKWNRALRADPGFVPPGEEVGRLRRTIHVEMGLLFLIPVAAALITRSV